MHPAFAVPLLLPLLTHPFPFFPCVILTECSLHRQVLRHQEVRRIEKHTRRLSPDLPVSRASSDISLFSRSPMRPIYVYGLRNRWFHTLSWRIPLPVRGACRLTFSTYIFYPFFPQERTYLLLCYRPRQQGHGTPRGWAQSERVSISPYSGGHVVIRLSCFVRLYTSLQFITKNNPFLHQES